MEINHKGTHCSIHSMVLATSQPNTFVLEKAFAFHRRAVENLAWKVNSVFPKEEHSNFTSQLLLWLWSRFIWDWKWRPKSEIIDTQPKSTHVSSEVSHTISSGSYFQVRQHTAVEFQHNHRYVSADRSPSSLTRLTPRETNTGWAVLLIYSTTVLSF